MPVNSTVQQRTSPVVHRQWLRARRRRGTTPSRTPRMRGCQHRRSLCCCRCCFMVKGALARSLRPHSPLDACPGAPRDKPSPRGCRREAVAVLWCPPVLTHLATASVPQDTARRPHRSASRRRRDRVSAQEGLQGQRRRRATAGRYRGGRGAVPGVLAHTLRRATPMPAHSPQEPLPPPAPLSYGSRETLSCYPRSRSR